ncbi:hypothetical protein LRH25_08015 [Ideonella azotifigens]|uniref:DUF1877 family protein n=1 Tax=Ideonella azotifigens TaxID=513160 RepID=A0ABP3V2D4_9BURK|nr:hypothetical protein [Ideonella azotifigens]MCD2340286.1 hypothetical protein [Ideonella azotifigens]
MLTDLIAAKPQEAEAILNTQGHANVWPTLESHSLDSLKLATLAFILQGKPMDAQAVAAFAESFQRLVDGGEDGPWIALVPETLVDDLAHLSDEQVDTVALAWARTEQAQLDRWDTQDVTVYLRELSAFAASAHAQHQSLLLWACL